MNDDRESVRCQLQAELDSEKSLNDRRALGQFSTPSRLAKEIVEFSAKLIPGKIRFMDPAFGTGAFYSWIVSEFQTQLETAIGYEIDPHYYFPAKKLWSECNLNLINTDFMMADPKYKCNLLICNPPYTRHHLIPADYKVVLHNQILNETTISLSGLSGMYCYYLLGCHKWLEPNAISVWLIPSEFMDVGYGKELKEYLLNNVTLMGVHRYNPEEVQFNDALVSSAIVWFRNAVPPSEHDILFSYGGTLQNPNISRFITKSLLTNEPKWTRFPIKEERNHLGVVPFSLFFNVKRGIATGDNHFFILERTEAEKLGLPKKYLQPILPSPRHLKKNVILSDSEGFPSNIPQLVLLNCCDDEKTIEEYSAKTYEYLKKGVPDVSSRYLCKKRKAWFFQEQRSAAPLLCSYMGRGNNSPFRFILNESEAIATNSYLMIYPTEHFNKSYGLSKESLSKAWLYLNRNSVKLLEEGRIYGGGLQKIEPKELLNVDLSDFDEFMRNSFSGVDDTALCSSSSLVPNI